MSSVFPCESTRMLPEGEQNFRRVPPPPHRGEVGDTGNAVHNLRDYVAFLEEGLSQMGAPSKMPFRF